MITPTPEPIPAATATPENLMTTTDDKEPVPENKM
jgi:hypothetical protein